MRHTSSHHGARGWSAWLLLGIAALLCAGCQQGPLVVAADKYAVAFDAARDLLRSYRFEIERVDAQAGTITTLPRRSGGALTPWDREQQSWTQEWDDTFNLNARRVRVTFSPWEAEAEPTGAAGEKEGEKEGEGAVERAGEESAAADSASAGSSVIPPANAEPTDMRTESRQLVVTFEVTIERRQRVGLRINPVSITRSSVARDPIAESNRLGDGFVVVAGTDDEFGNRLAEKLRELLARRSAG